MYIGYFRPPPILQAYKGSPWNVPTYTCELWGEITISPSGRWGERKSGIEECEPPVALLGRPLKDGEEHGSWGADMLMGSAL